MFYNDLTCDFESVPSGRSLHTRVPCRFPYAASPQPGQEAVISESLSASVPVPGHTIAESDPRTPADQVLGGLEQQNLGAKVPSTGEIAEPESATPSE